MTDVADITYDVPPNGRTVNSLAAYLANNAVFNVCDYGAVGDGTTDDTTAIQTASTACDAAGGGILYFPIGTYLISGAVTVTCLVSVLGAGPNVSMISAASQQQLKIKGSAGLVFGWGGSTVEGLSFTKVDLILGECDGDKMQGAQVINCVFYLGTYGIYFGFNCFFTLVDRCKMVDCTYGSFVDATTAGTSSGAMMRWRDCEIHDSNATCLSHYGIMLSGAGVGGYDLRIEGCEFERLTVGCMVVSGGTNRSFVLMRNIHFERMGADAYHIINDGAIVRLDGFYSFTASEAGFINSSGGRTSIANGFYNWIPGAFALVTGGTIQVDAPTMYSPSRWWGPNQQVMEVAGSTTGGMIVAKRTAEVGMSFVSTAVLTNASPAATAIVIAQAGDNNERVLEFVVNSTVVTTDNKVRLQIADGIHTVNCDMLMPLFVGMARLRLTWQPGTSVTVDGVFSATAPGATTTKGLYVTQSDTTSFGNVRFLNISTIKSGATCATLQAVDMTESISGPFQADT